MTFVLDLNKGVVSFIEDNKALASFDLIHVEVWDPYQTISSCGAVNLKVVSEYSCSVWT